jgi:type I site-specific restriction endonuclease
MDQTTLLYIMTAFVIIAALALCIQAGMLFGMYKTAKGLQDKISPLIPKVDALIPKVDAMIPKVDSLVESTRSTVEQSRVQIAEITSRANEILESAKNQMAMVEEVVTDATARAKVQMERVELVLDDTINRAHETVATVHNGIMRPLQELNGIAAGIRAALAFLARNNRPSVAQATSDEEMFI